MPENTPPSALKALIEKPGANSTPFRDGSVFPGRMVTLRAACPENYSPDSPVMFTHHGVGRNGADYRDYWLSFAAEQGWLVIVPEFSEEEFPDQPWYNRGNLIDEEGALNPPSQWTYQIDRLVFSALRDAGITRRTNYSLFGHSAGSQFVHRMLTFLGTDGVDAAAAANAGEYTLPLTDTDFPHGLRDLNVDPERLAQYFAFPLFVMYGEEDVDNTTKNFPSSEGAIRQGSTRVERAKFYFETAQAEAERMGVPFNWQLVPVPGVGHDGNRMSAAAGPLLLGALKNR